MTTNFLPITNIINVTITNTPSGLTERNVNSLALFTNELPSNLEQYGVYVSASQVADDYGTNSVTAQMANAIFAQVPNIRTGNGRLIVLPMNAAISGVATAVSATQGRFVSASLTANIVALKAVTNGDLKVTVDGTAYNLTGLNFTACADLIDIATILQNRLTTCDVTATTSVLTITSKKVGSSSTVALAAISGGTGTDLSGSGYFNAAGGTSTAGANSTGETLAAAVARTKDLISYTGVISNLDIEDAKILANASAIQALDMIYLQHVATPSAILGIGTDIKSAGDTHTRILVYTKSLAEANLFKAAYAGRAFSVNFNGSATTQTMNLKQLATIEPDDGISQTLYTQASTAGTDLYVSYQGVPSVFSTGGNDFFDNIYNDLALKAALEAAGFNYLRQTNTKVPQTEPGMNGLKSAYAQVCTRFVNNGAIAPGSWTSSERFGDPQIFDENILNTGYYIYSEPIILQNASDRELRIAPLVQIAIKRAGALHSSDVLVVIND